MTNYDLAIDKDGEPYAERPAVAGWRVRRVRRGRGRRTQVHGIGAEEGKPLALRANASREEMLAAAGPGKDRLEAVDEHWHKTDGVPVACTAQPSAKEDPSDDDTRVRGIVDRAARPLSYETVVGHMIGQQTRVVEKALAEMSAVTNDIAEVISAAHNAGIMRRVPALPSLPSVEVEDDEMAKAAEPEALATMLSEATCLIISETIDRVIPLLLPKFTAVPVTSIGGVSAEALSDRRRAAAAPESTASVGTGPRASAVPAPAAHDGSSSYTAPSTVSNVDDASSAPTSAAASVSASPAHPVVGVDPPVATVAAPGRASVVDGNAPSPDSPPGAAPAAAAEVRASNSPQADDEAGSMINAHMLRVWAGLSPPRPTRAGEVIAELPARDRTEWLAELTRLTVPEAIARACAVIHAHQPQAPPRLPGLMPPLPSAALEENRCEPRAAIAALT